MRKRLKNENLERWFREMRVFLKLDEANKE